MIRFAGVRFEYPGQRSPALNNVEWCVNDGEFALVTGPSGSGKSTLARCINGLVPHFHGGRFGGSVTVNGLDTRNHATAALSRHVGFVAQVPETQTITDRVEDEIAFGLESLAMDRSEMRVRVEETLDLLHLHHLRNRSIQTLSGGERQRVVIAAAMAMRPSVLVLDEPASQLDPISSDEIFSILTRLNRDLGMAVVLGEHRLERLLGVADSLLILSRCGAVKTAGPVRHAVGELEHLPPLQEALHRIGVRPFPLSIRDARNAVTRFASTNRAESVTASPHRPFEDVRASVELEKVSFGYDGRDVLDRVSLKVLPGSVTALMGRNGSGKTTLLKLINGLLRPSQGAVRVNRKDIASVSTVDLAGSVGYLPQQAGTLLFNNSVAEELNFTLRCRKLHGDVDDLLNQLDLQHLATRNPLDLSGGERLRAALAAVLIGQPDILLLDEPTRGVDAALKLRLGRIFRELARSGTTVVLATHDVDLVAEFADRLILLGDGGVVADGSPYDVMPGSLTLSTQINRVFGGRLLTVRDVEAAFSRPDHVT
ncbi:MAG: ATP-binding cassette domain-containing protein [Nitrolancea sp.]